MDPCTDFKQVVAIAGDALVVSDATGAITLWNAAAERIFGYSEAEALGASLDLICPDRLRHRHWEGYHKTMESGVTRYGTQVLRVPAINKAGDALSIAFTVSMLYADDHSISGILAVIRDETARFNEERALRKRLSELEAQLPGR